MENYIKKLNPKTLRMPTKAYSQGVLVDIGGREMLFIIGQLSQDINGDVLHENNAQKQTEVIFNRIKDILEEAGMSFENIVKLQIFLKNITDTADVSSVRDKIFKDIKPASLMLEVSNFVKNECLVEIEATAIK